MCIYRGANFFGFTIKFLTVNFDLVKAVDCGNNNLHCLRHTHHIVHSLDGT